MGTIYHQVSMNASEAKVYEAISSADGLSSWWGPHKSSQMDGHLVLSYDPGPEHGEVKLKVIDSVKNKRVEWECVSTHPKSSPASAWTGTHFIWEIMKATEKHAGLTVLDFRQTGYDESSKYFGSNNFAWAWELKAQETVRVAIGGQFKRLQLTRCHDVSYVR